MVSVPLVDEATDALAELVNRFALRRENGGLPDHF
jgi:hypothetical protein